MQLVECECPDLYACEGLLMSCVYNVLVSSGAIMQHDSMSLVMEYVPNGNLFKNIQQDSKGTLQWWDRGRHIGLDIAKGLAYLHSRKASSSFYSVDL